MSWDTGADPGTRDRVVTLQQLTASKDATTHAPKETWTTLAAPIWMAKSDARGQERFIAHQVSAAVETVWEMGYRVDMDPELVDVAKERRIVYQGRTYGVIGGRQIGRRDGIELFTLAAGVVA